MGMFDRIYDSVGREWQTKAFDRVLADYRIGDRVSVKFINFQVEILGGGWPVGYRDSYATIRNGLLDSVDDSRDHSLPLLSYGGGLAEGTIASGLGGAA